MVWANPVQFLLFQMLREGLNEDYAMDVNKPKTATLAFQMGPSAHKTGALIRERGHLNLQHTFGGAGTVTKNLKDQTSAIKQFDVPYFFQIPLLNWRDAAVNQDKLDFVGLEYDAQFFDLAFAQQHPCVNFRQTDNIGPNNLQVRQSGGQCHGFCQRWNRIPAHVVSFKFGVNHPSSCLELFLFLQIYSSPS
jgi:hypothetical protein